MSPRNTQACVAVLLALGGMGAVAAQADEAACRALATPGRFPQTTVRTAVWKGADAARQLPAYCEVTAVVAPVAKSRVGVVYRLPEGWNNKLIGFGGGGWAGNVQLETAAPGLAKGYATAQTDGGHPDPNAADASWAKDNPVAVTDFSHRAIHVMTTVAKAVVTAYYGQGARHAYYQGCSTGGRMGMMETQRYPDDYDGVIAGAPVYSVLTQTSGMARALLFREPGAALNAAQVKLVNAAAVAACDAADGVKDGVITDPRSCGWDPGALQCAAGDTSGQCLTAKQVEVLRRIYTTVRDESGIVGNYALTRGGEGGWFPFVPTGPEQPLTVYNGAFGDLNVYLFGRADYDIATFDPSRHQRALHATPFAKEYEATQADLKPFLKRGGKLLLWHGWDDPGPSPYATIDYFERAKKVNGPASAIELFVAPGVYHCRGGPGADEFDLIDVMDRWVEHGVAPQWIPARNRRSGIERPLCPWPALPYYKGSGDPAKLESFECRGPTGGGPR